MYFFPTIVLIFGFVTVDACKCVPPTQQTSYCRAFWISHARILGRQNLGNSIEYTVQHLEIFKNHTSLMPNKVFTPSSSAACGEVNLKIGKDYLLSGTINDGTKALQLSTCLYMPKDDLQPSGILLWSQVPADLYQKLLKKDFKPCPIQSRGASIRKNTQLHFSENLSADADTLIYKPRTYKYYQLENRHYQTTQPIYPYPQYQPVYYQQPTYYYPTYSYPSYGGGGFGFNFCLTCFSFGFGKKK